MNAHRSLLALALAFTVQTAHAAFAPAARVEPAEVSACRATAGCAVIAGPDGRPILAEETEAPDAATADVAPEVSLFVGPRRAAPAPAGVAPDAFEASWSRRREFGNSNFGAWIAAAAELRYSPELLGGLLTAEASGELGGRLLGRSARLLEAELRGSVNFRQPVAIGGGGRVTVAVLGVDVYDRSASAGGAIDTTTSYTRSFLSGSVVVFAGPVPLRFQGTIAGRAGVAFDLDLTPTGVEATVTPSADVHVTGSAAVDIGIARAGVIATLVLIEGSLPIEVAVALVRGAIEWSLEAHAHLELMAGRVAVFAEIGFGAFSRRWTHTLARWSGITWDGLLVRRGS